MKRRIPLAVIVLLLATGCTGLPVPGPSTLDATTAADGRDVTVVRVIDGDTMDIRYENGTTDRVRLLGVDTPETHTAVSPGEWEGVPDTPAGRACLENWGERASQYATAELDGRTVTLVIDPDSDVRGDYGRLLAYLVYDGSSFNRRLLETGHSRMYDSQFSKHDEFVALERAAMKNETGVWTCRTPTGDGNDAVDGDPSRSISVHPDAEGPDGENLSDEYPSITNTRDTDLDLDGVLSPTRPSTHTISRT